MKHLAQKLENTEGSDLIKARFLWEGTRIDWAFTQNFQQFQDLSSLLEFLQKKPFSELFYINDGYLQEEFLLKKENMAEFLSFSMENFPLYHYFVEKNGRFVVFIYNETDISYGEYHPIVKTISFLAEKITNLEQLLKNSPSEEKKMLIEEKKSLQEAIFQIKFCQKHQIFAKNIRKVHTLNDPASGGFFHLRISCDNETDNPAYWREIQKILLQNGDLIIEKN